MSNAKCKLQNAKAEAMHESHHFALYNDHWPFFNALIHTASFTSGRPCSIGSGTFFANSLTALNSSV